MTESPADLGKGPDPCRSWSLASDESDLRQHLTALALGLDDSVNMLAGNLVALEDCRSRCVALRIRPRAVVDDPDSRSRVVTEILRSSAVLFDDLDRAMGGLGELLGHLVGGAGQMADSILDLGTGSGDRS